MTQCAMCLVPTDEYGREMDRDESQYRLKGMTLGTVCCPVSVHLRALQDMSRGTVTRGVRVGRVPGSRDGDRVPGSRGTGTGAGDWGRDPDRAPGTGTGAGTRTGHRARGLGQGLGTGRDRYPDRGAGAGAGGGLGVPWSRVLVPVPGTGYRAGAGTGPWFLALCRGEGRDPVS